MIHHDQEGWVIRSTSTWDLGWSKLPPPFPKNYKKIRIKSHSKITNKQHWTAHDKLN